MGTHREEGASLRTRTQNLLTGCCLPLATLLFLVASPCSALELPISGKSKAVEVAGTLNRFSTVELTARGPSLSEQAVDNPFTNYRATAVFQHEGSAAVLQVLGFYAAHTDASENSATEGDHWQVRFSPPESGTWNFRFVIERIGAEKQVVFEQSGRFVVGEAIDDEVALTAHGHLRYVGDRYLQFAGSKKYYLKVGVDSPETLLGYADFDGTFRDLEEHPVPAPHAPIDLPALEDGLHNYEPHIQDWIAGDPVWQVKKGKGLIGGLNYLSHQGLNAVYFLTMNVNGDGRNVWPWTKPWQHDRFDCSKLDQWEIVFEHMQAMGLVMHVVLQETENDHMLDGGDLGPSRKLYLRELIARFAHHPGLIWNLGEENTQTVEQQAEMAAYIRELDPYDHPIVVHNDHWSPRNLRDTFDPHLGKPTLDGTAIQDFYWNDVHAQVKHYVSSSARAGKPWFVCTDEMGGAQFGLRTDSDDRDHFTPRSKGLWGNLMAGGAGVEWYFGWQNNSPHSDLSAESWRTREQMWKQSKIALDFFHSYLPFDEMKSADHLGLAYADYGFAKAGEVYCIYLFSGGATRLNLAEHTGPFEILWLNPRVGGPLRRGSVSHVWGPSWVDIGEPPVESKEVGNSAEKDWVALIRKVPATFTANESGLIAVEAEHFAEQTLDSQRRWYVLEKGGKVPDLAGSGPETRWTRSNLSASASASHRTFLRLLPDTRRSHDDKLIRGENFSPEPGKMAVLSYNVSFSRAGRYYVWVRAFSSNTEDNGLHVGIDGTWPESGRRMQWNVGKRSWRWECAQRTEQVHTGVPMQIWLDVAEPGVHSVSFSMREDGFAFDKFILTTDKQYRPSGDGPSERLVSPEN